MKNQRWCRSWCSTCTAPPVSRDDDVIRRNIQSMSVQTQRETRDTKEGEFKRDLRTNLLLSSYLRKPSPDGCFAGNGHYCVVRVSQILSQSFQAFRDVFPRERFPLRIPRIRSDFVTGVCFRIVSFCSQYRHPFSKTREKSAGENSSSSSSSSLTRETRVRGPIVCVT